MAWGPGRGVGGEEVGEVDSKEPGPPPAELDMR